MVPKGSMKPIWFRRVGGPRVARADMICHKVENDLHSALMSLGYQVLQISQSSKMRVDCVFVHGAIAVIVLGGVAVVGDNRSEPQRGHTQPLQVIQMLLDALQIASVIGAGIRAVECPGHARKMIVRGVAVREAVDHNEVKNVVLAETLEFSGSRRLSQQRKAYRFLAT